MTFCHDRYSSTTDIAFLSDFWSIGYGVYVREPDTIYERVARRVYKAQQYAAEHPLRRTWWLLNRCVFAGHARTS